MLNCSCSIMSKLLGNPLMSMKDVRGADVLDRRVIGQPSWSIVRFYKRSITFMPLYYTLFTAYNILNAFKSTGFVDLPQFHIDFLYLLIRIVIFVCMIIHVLTLRLTVGTYMLCIFTLSSVVAATLVSGNWNVLLLTLFLLCGREAKVSILARCVLWSNLAIILITALCFSRGIISAPVMMSRVGTVRNTFGFNHPNTLGMCILTTCCAYAVLRFRKSKWYDFFVYTYAFYVCNTLIYSRTAAVIIVIIALFSLATTIDHQGKLDLFFLFMGFVLFISVSVFSIWLMVCYNPTVYWMSQLNTFMSGRLDLANYYYETYSIHLFGYDFSSIQEAYKDVYYYFICDNAYAHVVLQSGVVVFLLIMFGYAYILWHSFIHARLTPVIFGLIIFVFVSFSESGGLFICNNFCLIALSGPLLGLRGENCLMKEE